MKINFFRIKKYEKKNFRASEYERKQEYNFQIDGKYFLNVKCNELNWIYIN